MKLASLRSGRDGELIVVSKDLRVAVKAGQAAPTMQDALDNWDEVCPALEHMYRALNRGDAQGAFALDLNALAAPLPRSYQYLDGAAYVSHIRRNRAARGEALPEDLLQKPLIYQGISHGFMSWNEDVPLPNEELGIDFEAEIAAVTGDVPMGVSAENATKHIRLFVLLNDISLRSLIPSELKRTFGFLTGKPASSMGPIAVTPDELGDLWNGRLVSGTMQCWVRGEPVGKIETGINTPFHYGDLIAHVAQTRNFEPGSIVGLGTVSNEDESAGCACIGEIRALETLKDGQPTTPFFRFGDRIRIEHLDREGKSVFGCIDQKFVTSIAGARQKFRTSLENNMLCKSLHHAAYRCKDARETVDFYTNVLGLKFIHAMGEDHVPSTGKYSPHIHIFFQMEDGSCIAFFELPRDAGQTSGRDPETPDWVQHFAFRVADKNTLLKAKVELEAKGIDVLGPTNHDDFLLSIYFFDPSGHRLELSAHVSTPEQDAQFEMEAMNVLNLWDQTHDWSQRARMFGGATGYKRNNYSAG